MSTLDKAIIASYKVEGQLFEIYVDPELAYQYLDGKKKDLKNILVVEEVYSDAKKAEKQKIPAIQKAFGSTEMEKILEIILRKGSVPLTTEERKRRLEERTKQIISTIMRETIDPRTNAPHTEHRVTAALEEAKVHIDPMKNAAEQLPDIIKALRPVIPLKFEKRKIAIKIPSQYSHKCYGALKSYGIQKEEWAKDGSLIVVIEIPAGMQGEVFDHLNKLTAGAVETKILER